MIYNLILFSFLEMLLFMKPLFLIPYNLLLSQILVILFSLYLVPLLLLLFFLILPSHHLFLYLFLLLILVPILFLSILVSFFFFQPILLRFIMNNMKWMMITYIMKPLQNLIHLQFNLENLPESPDLLLTFNLIIAIRFPQVQFYTNKVQLIHFLLFSLMTTSHLFTSLFATQFPLLLNLLAITKL